MSRKRTIISITILFVGIILPCYAQTVKSFVPTEVAVGTRSDGDVLYIGTASDLGCANCVSFGRTYFYIPISDPKAKSFEAIALSAISLGKSILIVADDATNTDLWWVGSTGCKIRTLRLLQ